MYAFSTFYSILVDERVVAAVVAFFVFINDCWREVVHNEILSYPF